MEVLTFSNSMLEFTEHILVIKTYFLVNLFARKGSILVEFKLTFKKKLENSEALTPLKEGIKGGRMGPWSVDPESLKVNEQGEGKQTNQLSLNESCDLQVVMVSKLVTN